MQYVFEILPGKPPIPKAPTDAEGNERVPDGQRLFGIEDAVKETGFNADWLRELWDGAMGEPPAAVTAEVLRKSGLRARYATFSDEHFDEFLKLCQLRGLNPFANQVYGILHHDRHRDRLVVDLLIGIEGMRLMAHRTREYAGCDAPEYSYTADDKPNGTCTVYRLVGGTRQAFTAQALWNEFAPPADVDEVWKTKPHVCIAKCAEAAALRKAFPQELGGLYAPEEWTQSQHMALLKSQKFEAAPKRDSESQIDPRVEEYSQVV